MMSTRLFPDKIYVFELSPNAATAIRYRLARKTLMNSKFSEQMRNTRNS